MSRIISEYAYTTGTLDTATKTINYVYGDTNWKDKMASIDGKAISYDAIGNPLSDGTWSVSVSVQISLPSASSAPYR